LIEELKSVSQKKRAKEAVKRTELANCLTSSKANIFPRRVTFSQHEKRIGKEFVYTWCSWL